MPDWVSELLRYGPLGAFALAVCWGGWIALRAGGAKAYTLGERYVASTEKLHDTLKESLDVQQTLCTQHGDSVGKISANVSSHDAAMRSVVRSACSMCRFVAQKEFPDSAVKVDEHTREIERIISEV